VELPRLDKVPAVATVMTPFPYSVDIAASVDEAERLMREHDVDQLPVQDGSALVGMVTERQLARLRASAAEVAGALTIGRITLRKPYVVDIHTPVGVVAAAMAEGQHDAALVVRDGRLAGIFTTTDACRTLAEICGQGDGESGDDVA
jgi:acetoin utilization protein AcuB